LVNKESNQTPNVPAPNPKPQNNPADSKNPPTSQDSTPTPSPNGNNPHSQQNQPPQPGKHSDLTELPPAYKQGQKRALERLNKVLDNSKSNSNDEDAKKIKAIQTNINSIKGNAFEQLIGVYLAYKYPDQQIIPQYCLVVEEKWCKEAKAMVGYCGMRADFRVGDTIYEIKWGANGSTFSINECVDKHLNAINNLKEKFKYKVLTCVQNTHAKARPMTPFLEEIQRELADDLGAIELFTQLTQALQNIATVKNAELLKHYQNAFYSIFEQTLKKQTQEIKEYIEGIIESLALHSLDDLVGTELLEFLRDNNLQQVPDPFLGNAMIEGKLRQVHVMLPDYLAENADLDDNLTENEDLNENAGQDDNAAPAPAPRPTPAIKPAHHHATSEAAPVGQREDAATEQADPQLTMQLPRQPLSQPWPLSQTIITQLARPPLAKNMQLQSKRANKWNLAPHMSSSSS